MNDDDISMPAIDESLIDNIKPKDELLLTHKGKIFKLTVISENTSFMEDYASRVTANARNAIQQIKNQYLEQLKLEKKKYQKYRKSHVPMPEISLYDIIKHKVMISKYNDTIQYNFLVNFKVTEVINEYTRKRVLLTEPILFVDKILSMTLNNENMVAYVRMFDHNGNAEQEHLHVNPEVASVCVGTTEIIGKKVSSFEDITKMKDRLMLALTRYNIYDAMFFTDERKRLKKIFEKALDEAPTTSWTESVWTVR